MMFASISCGSASEPAGPDVTFQVRGHVVEVVARSLTVLESLAIRDGEGKTWSFTARGFAGFTPSHLREHRALGQPVTVSYEETADGLVVVSIAD